MLKGTNSKGKNKLPHTSLLVDLNMPRMNGIQLVQGFAQGQHFEQVHLYRLYSHDLKA